MILSSLSVINFKNVATANCHFAPKLNCFFGGNGMGKTNLLDAIHYLSVVRGHLGTTDRYAIRHEAQEAIIQGEYLWDDGQEDKISLRISAERSKQLSRNGRLYKRHSDHIGRYPLVIISPHDQRLIRGGSDERRRSVDRILSQQDATYLANLINYNRALDQRNNMLRNQIHEPALMDILEETLATTGLAVTTMRQAYVEELVPTFDQIYQHLAAGVERAVLSFSAGSASTAEEQLRILRNGRQRDYEYGFTATGCHRDDFEMLLGENLMRKIGSEGQNKTYLIAYKLAEYRYLQQHLTNQTAPLLLLDDIFDKLDSDRVERIIELVATDTFGQIFITDTNRKYLDEIISSKQVPYRLFQIQEGSPTEVTAGC